MTWCYYAEAWR